MMGKWVHKPCGSFTNCKAERGNKAFKACNLGTENDTNKRVLLPTAGGTWLWSLSYLYQQLVLSESMLYTWKHPVCITPEWRKVWHMNVMAGRMKMHLDVPSKPQLSHGISKCCDFNKGQRWHWLADIRKYGTSGTDAQHLPLSTSSSSSHNQVTSINLNCSRRVNYDFTATRQKKFVST
jgi:hypothetical protein